ncbi:hypothetical protein L5515_007166 [Caenorhabditis briggsae]|uniref:Uncharacterized protein n=1 Tax=Caenorhabditis briggsae TaxID=6238 RepID=A0AAE9JKF1_CAEBR|nr:hypothetical protein L5515_007166 [Caenorhabditis briggsae]
MMPFIVSYVESLDRLGVDAVDRIRGPSTARGTNAAGLNVQQNSGNASPILGPNPGTSHGPAPTSSAGRGRGRGTLRARARGRGTVRGSVQRARSASST